MQLSKLLRAIFGSRFAEEYSGIILIIIAILILLLILWFLYKKRPELFMRSRRGPVNYSVHEDTIYGVDFDAEIACHRPQGLPGGQPSCFICDPLNC